MKDENGKEYEECERGSQQSNKKEQKRVKTKNKRRRRKGFRNGIKG